MKKLLLLSVIAAMVSSAAVAQESKDKAGPNQKTAVDQKDTKKPADMAAARAEWEKKVKDDLKLNADQTAKFDALNKEYNAKIDAIAQDASLDKDAQKEKKMALKRKKRLSFSRSLLPINKQRTKS
jgi:hypothetical protein